VEVSVVLLERNTVWVYKHFYHPGLTQQDDDTSARATESPYMVFRLCVCVCVCVLIAKELLHEYLELRNFGLWRSCCWHKHSPDILEFHISLLRNGIRWD